MTKEELLHAGINLVYRWCRANQVVDPAIVPYTGKPTFAHACAYYRDNAIHIWTNACAAIGTGGRLWSYPGYTVDRTPYGVLAHELGHHVDRAHGRSGGKFGRVWRAETRAEPISGYCDNDNEWFAEMFRVFVTNPDLLRVLRPTVYERMVVHWSVFVERRKWHEVIDSERHLEVLRKRVPTCPRELASR